MTGSPPLDRLSVRLEVVVRLCRDGDLEALAGYGRLLPDPEMLRDALERQRRGDGVVYLALTNRFPVALLPFDRPHGGGDVVRLRGIALLPPLRGRGVGRWLLSVAERDLARRGVRLVEVAVEAGDARARRFFERLGYAADGEPPLARGGRRLLRKELRSAGERAARWA